MQDETPATTGKIAESLGENPASKILADIESYTAWKYNDGFRWHLGASKIGHECKRHIWYGYRWIVPTLLQGFQARVFNRGHLEESRHDEWLRGIGFNVWTHDESVTKPDGTDPQLKIKPKHKGHFGGSVDRIVEFPERYEFKGYAIGESKTTTGGASFTKLIKEPLALNKPDHYAQACIYGYDFGIEYVLYMAANKTNDDLCIKVEKLDFKLAEKLLQKADDIIFSQTPPEKLSSSPDYYICKNLCSFKGVCHGDDEPAVNCRSCKNCSPVEDAEFYCSINASVIPREIVAAGCAQWNYIVGKVIPITKAKPKANISNYLIESDIPY